MIDFHWQIFFFLNSWHCKPLKTRHVTWWGASSREKTFDIFLVFPLQWVPLGRRHSPFLPPPPLFFFYALVFYVLSPVFGPHHQFLQQLRYSLHLVDSLPHQVGRLFLCSSCIGGFKSDLNKHCIMILFLVSTRAVVASPPPVLLSCWFCIFF